MEAAKEVLGCLGTQADRLRRSVAALVPPSTPHTMSNVHGTRVHSQPGYPLTRVWVDTGPPSQAKLPPPSVHLCQGTSQDSTGVSAACTVARRLHSKPCPSLSRSPAGLPGMRNQGTAPAAIHRALPTRPHSSPPHPALRRGPSAFLNPDAGRLGRGHYAGAWPAAPGRRANLTFIWERPAAGARGTAIDRR